MHHPFCLRHIPCILTIILVALGAVPSAFAQTIGEWTTSWFSPTNNVADFPGVIASAGKGEYIMASESTVHHTTDGGLSWAVVLNNPNEFRSRFSGVANPVKGHFIVLLDSLRYGGPETQVGRIFVSTNAGAQWMLHRRQEFGRLVDVSMFDGNHGIIGLLGGTKGGDSVLRTTDGGITWRGHPMPAGARSPQAVFALGPATWRLHAYDTASQAYYLYGTSDAGATWNRMPIPNGLFTFTFVDESSVWGAGILQAPQGSSELSRDLVMHSTDGGATWSNALDTAVKWTRGISAIAFADANNGMASGSAGRIYRTADGGTSWELQWMPTDRIVEYASIRELAYPVADEAIGVCRDFGVVAYHGRRTLVMPVITEPTTSGTPRPLEMTVAWTAVDGATAYDVQIADTIYEFNTVNHRYFDEPYFERDGLADTSVDVTLQEHKRYIIRVRARNATMVGDWSLRVYVRTIGEGKTLAIPTITSPPDMAQNQPLELDLTWTDVPTAVGYEYRVALEPTFIITHVDEEHHQGSSVRVTRLKPNTTYYARVRARDADGNLSDWSSITFVTGAAASVDDDARIELAASLHPNITSDHADLHLSLARSGAVRVRVVDAAGVDALPPIERELDASAHVLPIDVSTLASGRYFVRVAAGGREVGLGIVVVR